MKYPPAQPRLFKHQCCGNTNTATSTAQVQNTLRLNLIDPGLPKRFSSNSAMGDPVSAHPGDFKGHPHKPGFAQDVGNGSRAPTRRANPARMTFPPSPNGRPTVADPCPGQMQKPQNQMNGLVPGVIRPVSETEILPIHGGPAITNIITNGVQFGRIDVLLTGPSIKPTSIPESSACLNHPRFI